MLGLLKKPSKRQQYSQADTYQAMLRREATLGGQLFGPIPKGNRREFFCLDEHTWIWHEEWIDEKGRGQHRTTRYDVRPNGVLKVQDGAGYQQLTPEEATNLSVAIRLYHEHVVDKLYGHPQTA